MKKIAAKLNMKYNIKPQVIICFSAICVIIWICFITPIEDSGNIEWIEIMYDGLFIDQEYQASHSIKIDSGKLNLLLHSSLYFPLFIDYDDLPISKTPEAIITIHRKNNKKDMIFIYGNVVTTYEGKYYGVVFPQVILSYLESLV